MDYHISELLDGYIDHEFEPVQSDISPENVKALVAARLNVTPIRKKKRVGRIILLAATIVLALSAAAVAVYQYGLQDLVFEERDNGSVGVSVLGWRETPEYRAFAEWDAYETEYNSTHEIPQEDDPSIPAAYLRAGAWSPEMVDALDAILARYDLTMHDNATITLPADGSGIDVGAILPNGGSAGGYAYRDGTLKLDITQKLPDGETVEYQLFSAVKGTFSNVLNTMDGEAEEWLYTAADGTGVNLIMGEYVSMIVADMDHVFVTVRTVFGNVSDREALEALADSIGWTALNACEGFTDEYYAAYRAALEERAAAAGEAQSAREEIDGDWTLTSDIYTDYYPEERGGAEDGAVWMEWTYTSWESEGTIRLRYERPAGDIGEAFRAMLAQSGAEDAALILKDVPVYVRTESAEDASTVTEYRDFTVYIDEAADGSVKALWLDVDKELIFTLETDPGELTSGELEAQIKHLLGGREPSEGPTEPEVIWARLGHYEPTWLPEGWTLEPETMLATAGTLDGAWSGFLSQAYVTGEIGQIIWFTYQTAPSIEDPLAVLMESFGYSDEVLNDPYFLFTETTVNGHPALLLELNDMTRSPSLVWLDEEAGVLFSLHNEVSLDADTIRAIAESVAAQ